MSHILTPDELLQISRDTEPNGIRNDDDRAWYGIRQVANVRRLLKHIAAIDPPPTSPEQ